MPRTTTTPSAVEQDVHEQSQYARARLGEKIRTADGRVYRYAKNGGTALAAGKLVVAADAVANHTDVAVAAAAAVGDNQVTVTLGATAATADQYAEGYLVINNEAGEGITYKIRNHPAADSAASLTVTLEDPVKVALTTSSKACLVYNAYDNVVISAVDQADLGIGIPNIAVTASYYFWVQTGGVVSALADEAYAKGAALTIGSSVAGALEAVDAAGEQQLGICLDTAVDTEYKSVFLTLDS